MLQSMGWQRVRHDLVIEQQLKTQLPLEQNIRIKWMMHFSFKNTLVGFIKTQKVWNLASESCFLEQKKLIPLFFIGTGHNNAKPKCQETDIDCGFSLTYLLKSIDWTAAHVQPICPGPKASYQEIIQRQCMSSSCFSWGSLKDPKPKLPRLWKSAALLKSLWSKFLNKTTVKWTMMGLEARVFVKQGLAGLNKVTLILT